MEPNEQVKRKLWEYGHYHNAAPVLCEGLRPSEEPPAGVIALHENSPEQMAVTHSYQTFHSVTHDRLCRKTHRRAADYDGLFGPVTEELVLHTARCGHPDFGGGVEGDVESSLGRGNWKGCHGTPDEHHVWIKINGTVPPHLTDVWDEILDLFIASEASVGVRVKFVESGEDVNWYIDRFSGGWLGLAHVMNGVGCGATGYWAKMQNNYRVNSSRADRIIGYFNLMSHEGGGHNKGWNHTPESLGSIMSAYLVANVLSWKDDPLYRDMLAHHGGKPIASGDDPDDPPIAPDGCTGLLGQLSDCASAFLEGLGNRRKPEDYS